MGDYVDLNGVKTWYDAVGSDGDALVLLHGGLGSNAEWGMHLAPFGEHFRVFAPERRGHGHSPDVEGPITYEVMADDTIAFLEQVVREPAHLVGWSDGGDVALLVAIARPDLVKKIVLIGSNYDSAGLVSIGELRPDDPGLMMIRVLYEGVTPDGPEHWPVVFEKITDAWENFHIVRDDLSKISAPTLVMAGDDDAIKIEHTIDMYDAIPGAELAIVPGTSHLLPLEKPELMRRLILEFLQNVPPATLMPIRRATG